MSISLHVPQLRHPHARTAARAARNDVSRVDRGHGLGATFPHRPVGTLRPRTSQRALAQSLHATR